MPEEKRRGFLSKLRRKKEPAEIRALSPLSPESAATAEDVSTPGEAGEQFNREETHLTLDTPLSAASPETQLHDPDAEMNEHKSGTFSKLFKRQHSKEPEKGKEKEKGKERQERNTTPEPTSQPSSEPQGEGEHCANPAICAAVAATVCRVCASLGVIDVTPLFLEPASPAPRGEEGKVNLLESSLLSPDVLRSPSPVAPRLGGGAEAGADHHHHHRSKLKGLFSKSPTRSEGKGGATPPTHTSRQVVRARKIVGRFYYEASGVQKVATQQRGARSRGYTVREASGGNGGGAPVLTKPGPKGRTIDVIQPHEVATVVEIEDSWLRVESGGWVAMQTDQGRFVPTIRLPSEASSAATVHSFLTPRFMNQCRDFYSFYSPEKLTSLEQILGRRQESQEQLTTMWGLLVKKYGEWPPRGLLQLRRVLSAAEPAWLPYGVILLREGYRADRLPTITSETCSKLDIPVEIAEYTEWIAATPLIESSTTTTAAPTFPIGSKVSCNLSGLWASGCEVEAVTLRDSTPLYTVRTTATGAMHHSIREENIKPAEVSWTRDNAAELEKLNHKEAEGNIGEEDADQLRTLKAQYDRFIEQGLASMREMSPRGVKEKGGSGFLKARLQKLKKRRNERRLQATHSDDSERETVVIRPHNICRDASGRSVQPFQFAGEQWWWSMTDELVLPQPASENTHPLDGPHLRASRSAARRRRKETPTQDNESDTSSCDDTSNMTTSALWQAIDSGAKKRATKFTQMDRLYYTCQRHIVDSIGEMGEDLPRGELTFAHFYPFTKKLFGVVGVGPPTEETEFGKAFAKPKVTPAGRVLAMRRPGEVVANVYTALLVEGGGDGGGVCLPYLRMLGEVLPSPSVSDVAAVLAERFEQRRTPEGSRRLSQTGSSQSQSQRSQLIGFRREAHLCESEDGSESALSPQSIANGSLLKGRVC